LRVTAGARRAAGRAWGTDSTRGVDHLGREAVGSRAARRLFVAAPERERPDPATAGCTRRAGKGAAIGIGAIGIAITIVVDAVAAVLDCAAAAARPAATSLTTRTAATPSATRTAATPSATRTAATPSATRTAATGLATRTAATGLPGGTRAAHAAAVGAATDPATTACSTAAGRAGAAGSARCAAIVDSFARVDLTAAARCRSRHEQDSGDAAIDRTNCGPAPAAGRLMKNHARKAIREPHSRSIDIATTAGVGLGARSRCGGRLTPDNAASSQAPTRTRSTRLVK
jgi:hypothetical protein